MDIEVTLVTNNSSKILNALDSQIKRALEACGMTAEKYASDLVPVDTGNLKNSLTHITKNDAVYIGSNVNYAAYVEMGTIKMEAQPYLRPAIENNVKEYGRIIEKYLK